MGNVVQQAPGDARSLSPPGPKPSGSKRRVHLQWALVTGLCALVGALIAVRAEIAFDREALWRVVEACVADDHAFGVPFPCSEVDLRRGVEAGFVVLRPPVGPVDLVLSPTRHIVGIEDPELRSPGAPNYLADAWDVGMRRLESRGGERLSSLAVAVNPRESRTQDQLHVHIGCQTPWVRRALSRFAPLLKGDAWSEIGRITADAEFWALRAPRDSMRRIDPIQAAKDHFAGAVQDSSRLIVVVAALPEPHGDSVAILAADAKDPLSGDFASTGELVDAACVQ